MATLHDDRRDRVGNPAKEEIEVLRLAFRMTARAYPFFRLRQSHAYTVITAVNLVFDFATTPWAGTFQGRHDASSSGFAL